MSVILLPNVEALVRNFLADQAEVTALCGGRVYTVLPKAPEFPALRVTQFYDTKITPRPLWLVEAQLQVDAWGGSKFDAWELASTAQAVMGDRLEGGFDEGVVTHCTFNGLTDQPDRDYEPAKPRFFFTAAVTCHPVRDQVS